MDNASHASKQGLDHDVSSFLSRLNLTELTGIFEKEELCMEDVMSLCNEELKVIGVEKHKQRKLILNEVEKLKASSSLDDKMENPNIRTAPPKYDQEQAKTQTPIKKENKSRKPSALPIQETPLPRQPSGNK